MYYEKRHRQEMYEERRGSLLQNQTFHLNSLFKFSVLSYRENGLAQRVH